MSWYKVLVEKIFVIRWGQSQRGKGAYSSSFTMGLEMSLKIEIGRTKGVYGSVFSLFVVLQGAGFGLAGGACWSRGLGRSNEWAEGGWKGKICGGHRRWAQWDTEGWQRCSAAELVM